MIHKKKRLTAATAARAARMVRMVRTAHMAEVAPRGIVAPNAAGLIRMPHECAPTALIRKEF